MRIALLVIGFLAAFGFARVASAQDQAWVQIEAQPSLTLATERARAYASLFPETNGFQVGSGWYAVVLGPYEPAEAAGRLVALKAENLIPRDSFISDGANHRQQFWPVGSAAPQPLAEAPVAPEAVPLPEVAPDVAVVPDETPGEARASEAALDIDARMALQEALRWYGFYSSAIDGAFGPGTRNSMAAWQEANGYEPTGILTTLQRAKLQDTYAADIAEFGFQTITEAEAGIEITLPTALVQFDHYEPPFVHFTEKNGSGLSIILISQPGDTASLAGLYDVLQTLAVVPPVGDRERKERSFTISGRNDSVESYAFAAADKGHVKGYLAVWKPSDAARMQRILPALQASFRAVGDTSLDPGLVPLDAGTRSGLLAGLEVRHPVSTQSGFFIDAAGRVLTSAKALSTCGKITIEGSNPATLTFSDAGSDIAVLTPNPALAPHAVAAFQGENPRAGSEIVVAGYSWGEKLPAPVLTYGVFEEGQGLQGEADVSRVTVPVKEGDVGGPVVDLSGAVLGMLLPEPSDATRTLPQGVAYIARANDIVARLATQGVALGTATSAGAATPDALNAQALGMTVLVSCWE